VKKAARGDVPRKDSIEVIASELAATMLAGPQSGSLMVRQIGAYQIIDQIGRRL
jgi:hypothetical protein